MKYFFSTLVLVMIAVASYAQSGTYLALNQFLGTEFFQQYETIRQRAEKSVRDFQLIQDRYSDEDVAAVRDAYNSSAEYFNVVLLNIKADLLHKDKRKYLIKYPASYSKQIEADLYRAKEYYANTFQREITEVTNGEISGSALLTLMPQIIKYAKLAVDIVKKIQSEVKKFNEQLLDKYLVEPYRFKMWDEIN